MVPDGWREAHVGNLISSMDAGVSVNSNSVPAPENQIGVLKTSCVSDGVFVPRRNKWVKEVEEQNRVREHVRADTIIMSRMNTPDLVGANAYVGANYPNLFLPDRLWALKPNPGDVHCRWLAYWLGSAHTRFTISRIATGTSGSMKNITKVDVRALKIWVPPLPEQKKIADILSTWDKAIETTGKLLANAEAQKRALMQQLLTGKRRLPGFEGREWQEVRLGDCIDLQGGFAFKSSEFVEEGIPIIRIANVVSRVNLVSSPHYERRDDLSQFLVQDGDILISMTGYVGKIGVFHATHECPEAYLNQRVGRVKLKERGPLTRSYLRQLLETEHFQRQVENAAAGGAQPNVSSKDVCAVQFRVPTVDEQTKIATMLNDADNEIAALGENSKKLRTEKKALLQQLLTGKRRVTL